VPESLDVRVYPIGLNYIETYCTVE
jgi:hypothetical protein